MIDTDSSFFLPYQKRWIADRSALKIMEKSRQIGLSWTAAYALVREQAAALTSFDTWVSSRDELQAELFITDCANFANILHTAAERSDRVLLDDNRGVLARSLKFASGRRIHALSSNPNAQAGKRGTRLLDEFALHPDPRELYTIALPGITWGGRLEIISTHRGAGNFFNQLIIEITQKGNPKNFSHHRVTLETALSEGFLNKLKTKLPAGDPRKEMTEEKYFEFIRNQCADEAAFRQEYLCDPSFDERSFLTLSLILAAQSDDALPAEITGPLHIGVDLGRTHDRTAIIVLEKISNRFFTRELISLHDTPFAQQEATLDKWASHPACRSIAIDASGLGRQFFERAQSRYGAHRVEGIVFTDERKAELAYEMKDAFERHRVQIPTLPMLREDLMSVEKSYSPAGLLRFSAPRNSSGHADNFWALALALWSSRRFQSTSSPIEIPTIERNRGQFL